MEVIKYKTKMTSDRIPKLVKESGHKYGTNELNTPEKIVTMMKEVFELHQETEEYVYEICFDNKMKPIAVFEVSHGAVNASLITPREVYMKALLSGAFAIAILHNHTSGDCRPSAEDDQVKERLKRAGEMLGFKLVDFLIVGDEYYSYANEERL